MIKAKRSKTTTKRIRNPVTGTYYRLRVKSTSAGKRGTIMGKWKSSSKSSKKK